MTAPSNSDNNLRIAITGTVVVHALLFLLLAWILASNAARRLWEQANKPPKEKEVTLLFPDQIIPPPKLSPPPKPQVYIRTTQNERLEEAPKNPAFISDRNTKAATLKAPSPDATEPMPSMDGLRLPTRELADRDYRDGELKDDARPKTPPKELAMLQPQPMMPPASTLPDIKMPQDATPPPLPVVPPQNKTPSPSPQPLVKAQAVAKSVTESTALTKMMDEMDKDVAKMDQNRLSIDVKRAEQPDTPQKTTDAPPKTNTQMEVKPLVSEAVPHEASAQKPIPKALPVVDDDVVTRTTPNQAPNAFTPHTRTTQMKGTVANRGSAPSVDAEDTPVGRYIRLVTGTVDKKWHHYCHIYRAGVSPAYLEMSFYVNKKGKVEGVKVVNDKESNPMFTGLTLKAIMDSEIPPIPVEVVPSLPMNDQERLKIEYKVIVY